MSLTSLVKKLADLAILMYNQMDTDLIYDVMKHLVKFKMVKYLVSKESASPFQESFSIHITSSGKFPLCKGPTGM